ncbi:MAG: hypothetical protein NVS2B11_05460 [Acetobacteraceae bacterium]
MPAAKPQTINDLASAYPAQPGFTLVAWHYAGEPVKLIEHDDGSHGVYRANATNDHRTADMQSFRGRVTGDSVAVDPAPAKPIERDRRPGGFGRPPSLVEIAAKNIAYWSAKPPGSGTKPK